MADEVPICDVLCEAMEYLSKLGSNLRARSESLKEKRIRKDKLKNTHAVQKAADKVLLICELSKKSLENVECGVKKVLSLVQDSLQNKSGTSDTSSSAKTKVEKESYQYFKYRSHKLRISKKVPIKHYMSAKILARSMPVTMQEKYPVYYNCKLYRKRKRDENCVIQEESTEKFAISDEKIKQKDNTDVFSEKIDDPQPTLESEFQAQTIDPVMDVDNDTKGQDQCEKRKMSVDSNKSKTDIVEMKSEIKQVHGSHSVKNLRKDDEKSFETAQQGQIDTVNRKIKTKRSPKKFKHIRIIDDDSSENSDQPVVSVKQNEADEVDEVVEDDDSLQIHRSKKMKLSSLDGEQEQHDINSININQTDATEQLSEAESSRPKIKCVSINKLLKPDVLQKNKEKLSCTNSKQSNKSEIFKKGTDNLKENHKSKKKKQISDYDDKEYWKEKRKEVGAFKPKICVINVIRLPKFSVSFLQNNNLKKITQNKLVICEIVTNKDQEIDDSVDIVGKDSNTNAESLVNNNQCDNITKVKSALLDDSDSEKSDIRKENSPMMSKIAKTVRNALLHDSDNESRESVKVTKEISNDASDKHDDKLAIDDRTYDKNTITSVNCGVERDESMQEDISSNNYGQKSDLTIETLKKNLLLDSDSDKNSTKGNEFENTGDVHFNNDEKSKVQDTESIKNRLLYETDSDKEDLNFSLPEKSLVDNNLEKEHNSGLDNDNNKTVLEVEGKDKEAVDNEDEKKSSENGIKSPLLKKKKFKNRITKSKRKNIMESMHAKKMLLTYSSSSDTEDEQLRNVFKDIKNSLLKGVSSEDEKQANDQGEKSCSSSGSELDILNRVKKNKQDSKTKTKAAEEESIHSQSEYSKKKSSNDGTDEESDCSSKKMGRSRAQPGGSSQNSNSQDAIDKDIDGLTNLNNLTKSRRRRDSTSADETDKSSLRLNKKVSKAPLISEVNMLKANSSSEAGSVSGVESDAGEDLPPVSISDLNGSGVDHLAKDDLLDESDASSSHNEESKNESGDSNPKSKRRKAIAISSDSEAGSSRKKNLAVKVSDFEDSEDESSEPMKRGKRKKTTDSDASIGSSSTDGKKKRRRIKQINDSDASGSDTENEGRNKHGRKNIRKVMSKNQLEEATKKAAREEKERIARITERQKLYNNLEFDESGKPDEVVLEKVVLDFEPETKEPLIQVDRGLVKKLKPHQANGIKFMWDACFESVKRIKKDRGSGCILAHCMGLGKTLQVVSLTHTLLTHNDLTTVNRVLVVCPLSTVLNWVNEFRMWLKHTETEYDVDVYELSRHKQNSERAFQLQQWFAHGGVCVLGYEMFRNLSADNPKKFKKKMLKSFQEALVDPGPDLVVCDEGHLLKNEKTSLSQSMNRVRTRRRIVLTGTPLQNNLKEYYCMVQFVKPNLLGKYNEYLNRFVNPITNGQYTDSTEHDIRIMKRRSHVLHKMLDGAVQRRDYGVLAPFLPPKHEYVLFITLTDVQVKLYQFYLDNYSRRPLPGKSSGFLFPDFQSLQRIWTHPLVLKYNSERYEIMQQKKREREEEEESEGSLVDFIDDESSTDESTTEESSDDVSEASDDSRKKSKKKKSQKKNKAKDSKVSTRRGTRANPVELDEDEPNNDVIEIKAENPTEWWIKLVTDDELEDMRNSHKLILLFDILRQCEAIGDKLLVFSQSLYSLDLIEHFLGKVDEATQEGRIDEKLGGHVGSWSPGVDYFRLDGSTSCENRSIWCKNFNREDNPRARLFLISTRAGGLGINLVAANRVVIFDVSWNPSHDVQSIFRVYRFGQKKPCYVYRFLAMGTMEEKIYERQVTKQAISKRVIDEQQIDRHYAENDLAELYKFEPRPPTPRPLPPLPKDRLFAEMLREHEDQIYKYHEHDSLLENKEEETLSEEERKAAWEDFENEKNRPPPAPFPSAWPMHNGMVPGLLAQQQQQLAYTALAAMLRKDMPNINDNQIRDMLPLIYNANPALMQKMSELYKYAPPGGMMNPAMMNPVMNAGGGGGGGGMGGTSGLQYEPPWQRQHQQQQQLRLQQLMQHQNPMGAKYYAGGLGSRDPVAMALQQQRAREIMAGESRGRPRGRPPLQPRVPAPAPAPGDVVNLDSD